MCAHYWQLFNVYSKYNIYITKMCAEKQEFPHPSALSEGTEQCPVGRWRWDIHLCKIPNHVQRGINPSPLQYKAREHHVKLSSRLRVRCSGDKGGICEVLWSLKMEIFQKAWGNWWKKYPTRVFCAGSHPWLMKPELLEPECKSGAVFLAIAYPVCRFCLASAFLASMETGYCIFNLDFPVRIEKNWDVSVGWFVAFTQFGGKI